MAENKKTSGADTTVERVRVAIVGAGIAGLAACLKLLESNIKDVRLIEVYLSVFALIWTRAYFVHDYQGFGSDRGSYIYCPVWLVINQFVWVDNNSFFFRKGSC